MDTVVGADEKELRVGSRVEPGGTPPPRTAGNGDGATPRRSKHKRPRTRDAERSRTAILDAAEQLFADYGYQGASLTAISQAAGVSPGLPAYFFGSKEGLHARVLARLLERRDRHLAEVRDTAEGLIDGTTAGTEAALRELVSGYIGFLMGNPTFVHLLTRDAMEHIGRREQLPRHATSFAEGLRHFLAMATTEHLDLELDHLLLSVVAMCYFPLEHDSTIVAGMGHRAWTQSFQDRRIEHIVRLLMPSLGRGSQNN